MKQWSVAKLNKDNAKRIAEQYDLPPLIATLLDIRGIVSEEDIRAFLYDEGGIDSPFEMKDMDKAAQRVRDAVDNGEKICVYGDYDADGVTSTALLFSYLETIGADVIYYIPDRETEGYGMNMSAVDKLKEKNIDLIVTVDNGISAVGEIAYAKSLGIDTVVTDHHMPGAVLPDAVAVVDMHRADCPSRFKNISGVGAAFKLVIAIEGEYADVDMLLDNYSDLLCIGTIGDIMPLVDENRVFVKRGLRIIENGDRAGVRALVEESGLKDREITAGNVSFGLVPRINAVGRLGLSSTSVSLLLSDDYEKAREIARSLGEDNTERRRIEKEILESINRKIAADPSLVYDRVLIIDGEGWHQGVIGIVCSRVKDVYGKPCIILSRSGDKARGSGRSVEGFDLWEAIVSCKDMFGHFGGHPMAVGLSLDSDKIDEFRRRINAFAAAKEMPYDKLKIDCRLNPAALGVELAEQLNYLSPFGSGNPTPVFELRRLRLNGITPLSGDKHLRLTFGFGNTSITAMKFFSSSADFVYRVGDMVDIAVNLEVNEFRDNRSLSVIIKDIKFSDVENTDYIRSLRLFEQFCRGEALTGEEALSLIPDRNDFAAVYRFLRSRGNNGTLSLDVIAYRLGGSVSYGKLKVILEAMNELGIIAIYEDMYKTEIKLPEVSGKVNLEDSVIVKKLKEVYRNGQI